MESRPSVSLSTFAEYVVAPSSRKIGAVQQAVELYGRSYHPRHDFYKPWRDALRTGLLWGDLEPALRRAGTQAPEQRRRHFTDPHRWAAEAPAP